MKKKDTDVIPGDVQFVKGVGPKRAKALAKEGIVNPPDLLRYFPRAYIDRNAMSSLLDLARRLKKNNLFENNDNEFNFQSEVTVIAEIADVEERRLGRNRKMLKFKLTDQSGGFAFIVFWRMTDFFKKKYKRGYTLSVSGKPELDKYGGIQFNHPEIEIIDPEDVELYKSGKILPKYRMTESMKKAGITIRLLRNIISNIIDAEIRKLDETLPPYLLEKLKLPDIQATYKNLHFPESAGLLDRSLKRMKFEEIFIYELYLALHKSRAEDTEKAPLINPKSESARKLYDSLPFSLTPDQKRVLNDIAGDFRSGRPMNRLLQGDVGSGKTIVALLAILQAIDSGNQAAFMAPTEILAEQHFNSIKKYLEDFDINIVQLVGGQKARMRREIQEKIESGEANIIVGTHAMFQSEVLYRKLGLVIIDEQHRFGVAQRAELKELGKKSFDGEDISPHILVMTATPIPRTLSMTVYGDLDVSFIKTMPKNRKPIITRVTFDSKLPEVYEFIRQHLKDGRQAYIVYPLVEKSEKMELKAATDHYEKLKDDIFPDFRCGLLHGQMFWYEKDDAMRSFLDREFDILVATTVIEVGIDVPNATIMLIENAERFGLSQLHQLRGRVGRGSEQSYCVLVTKDNFRYVKNKKNPDDPRAAVIRLNTMEQTTDGFKISEVDMKLRGPGDMLGTKQSGMPDFEFIDLVQDGDIITYSRRLAFDLIDDDPHLRKPENLMIRKTFLKKYSEDNFYDVA